MVVAAVLSFTGCYNDFDDPAPAKVWTEADFNKDQIITIKQPGRCRYIRERSQPTASLLLFPGFLSGIRPGRNERSKRRKTGKTRHPVRSGIQSGYIGPTRRAASYGRPPANRPPHATSRPAPKKRDTRGTNGDTVRSFRKRSGPFPSVGRSCGQRSAAAKRCKRPILSRNGNRFPACRYDANKTSQARETNQDGE